MTKTIRADGGLSDTATQRRNPGNTTLVVPANGPFSYTAGPTNESIMAAGGAGVTVTLDGTAVLNANFPALGNPPFFCMLFAGRTITFTYTNGSPPTVISFVGDR